MKILTFLFVSLTLINIHDCFGAAAEVDRPLIEKRFSAGSNDFNNVRLAIHARLHGTSIPSDVKPEDFLEKSTVAMPPPLPRIDNLPAAMDLARDGESVPPYLLVMLPQMTHEGMMKKDFEGQTALIKVINDEMADFPAFRLLVQKIPELLFVPDEDGVLPIFSAISAEKTCSGKSIYAIEIFNLYVHHFKKIETDPECFLYFMEITLDPILKKSIHDEILSLKPLSPIRNAYNTIIAYGIDAYIRLLRLKELNGH